MKTTKARPSYEAARTLWQDDDFRCACEMITSLAERVTSLGEVRAGESDYGAVVARHLVSSRRSGRWWAEPLWAALSVGMGATSKGTAGGEWWWRFARHDGRVPYRDVRPRVTEVFRGGWFDPGGVFGHQMIAYHVYATAYMKLPEGSKLFLLSGEVGR